MYLNFRVITATICGVPNLRTLTVRGVGKIFVNLFIKVYAVGNYECSFQSPHHDHMSRVVRKPDFCICENKDADQLCGYREANQRLCFRYIDSQSLYFLKPKFQASSHLLWLYSQVWVGPGRDRFSQNKAHTLKDFKNAKNELNKIY